MNTKLNKWIVAMGVAVASTSTFAASDTGSLGVGASVSNVCAIGGGYLSFGNVSLLVTQGVGVLATTYAADAGHTVPVICTNGATAQITADAGMYASGGSRRMASGANRLVYELYADAGRTTVLDSSTGAISYTGTGTNQTVMIYGRISAANLAGASSGDYDDTVALTITYTP